MSDSLLPQDSAGPRWRLIVGVIGLIYGIGGSLMWIAALAGSLLWGPMMKMAGMGDIQMPAVIRLTSIVQSAVLVALGILLAIGSMNLLRMRPSGASIMRAWVVVRMFVLIASFILGFVLLPTQVAFQVKMVEVQRDVFRERGVPEKDLPVADPAKIEAWMRYSLGGISLVAAAFPIFVGVVLTNRKKKAEIDSWRTMIR
ncbi:MAG: hypothetical protein SGJ09_01680 [Phycisphaerae bacterium]|nr:hypothetical protein [Phycisphaerae bacterium]